jgi:hypothetical protein
MFSECNEINTEIISRNRSMISIVSIASRNYSSVEIANSVLSREISVQTDEFTAFIIDRVILSLNVFNLLIFK